MWVSAIGAHLADDVPADIAHLATSNATMSYTDRITADYQVMGNPANPADLMPVTNYKRDL
jgi:hypothetical protein